MADLPVSVETFRTMFQSAFADSSIYLDDDITSYLTLAAATLNPLAWQNLLNQGIGLMTAHFLALDAREAAVAKRGGVPGQAGVGVLSSKSIGGVSATYDMSRGTEANAGHWNLTTYGLRYYRLMNLAGMGGVQITGNIATLPAGSDRTGPVF